MTCDFSAQLDARKVNTECTAGDSKGNSCAPLLCFRDELGDASTYPISFHHESCLTYDAKHRH